MIAFQSLQIDVRSDCIAIVTSMDCNHCNEVIALRPLQLGVSLKAFQQRNDNTERYGKDTVVKYARNCILNRSEGIGMINDSILYD